VNGGDPHCYCTHDFIGVHCEKRIDHCPTNFTAIRDEYEFCYYFGTKQVNWEHARDFCVRLSDMSTLAVLEKEETNTALQNYLLTSKNFSDCDSFFIALRLVDDTNCAKGFIWKPHYRYTAVPYSEVEYPCWAEGQPNCAEHNGEYQACGTLHTAYHYRWNDEYCGARRCYICQVRRSQY
jgi:hypothetical protein